MTRSTHWMARLLADLEPPRARKLAKRMVALQHAQRRRADTPAGTAVAMAWFRVDRCLRRCVVGMLGGES